MNTKTTVTAAARKIAKLHNDRIKAGFAGNGFLLVSEDGSGGAWYSDNSRPNLSGAIKVNIGRERMTGSEAQELLDGETN